MILVATLSKFARRQSLSLLFTRKHIRDLDNNKTVTVRYMLYTKEN